MGNIPAWLNLTNRCWSILGSSWCSDGQSQFKLQRTDDFRHVWLVLSRIRSRTVCNNEQSQNCRTWILLWRHRGLHHRRGQRDVCGYVGQAARDNDADLQSLEKEELSRKRVAVRRDENDIHRRSSPDKASRWRIYSTRSQRLVRYTDAIKGSWESRLPADAVPQDEQGTRVIPQISHDQLCLSAERTTELRSTSTNLRPHERWHADGRRPWDAHLSAETISRCHDGLRRTLRQWNLSYVQLETTLVGVSINNTRPEVIVNTSRQRTTHYEILIDCLFK